jgi:hypothetical protein
MEKKNKENIQVGDLIWIKKAYAWANSNYQFKMYDKRHKIKELGVIYVGPAIVEELVSKEEKLHDFIDCYLNRTLIRAKLLKEIELKVKNYGKWHDVKDDMVLVSINEWSYVQ